ncbi:Endonuclease/exonuclease/phosphatase superfamily [Sesbania bispinosa]|nr:Endonuclease/exonuclease/phosphatase superfamily [Sesbania bispinosa]
MDIDLKGCKFTWFSSPHQGVITREKLDRIMANWRWRSLFPNAIALAVPQVSSDHTPLILWPSPKPRGGSSFKFEAFWEEHADCEAIINKGWYEGSREVCVGISFLNKMNNCRSTLRDWSRTTFKRADQQIKILTEELQYLLNSEKEKFNNNWGRIQEGLSSNE